MEDSNELVTIIFERKLRKSLDGISLYTYTPIQVLSGFEQVFNKTKVFSCPAEQITFINDENSDSYNQETDCYEFNYIDDICAMDEQYVYGFSLIVNNAPQKELRKIMNYVEANIDDIKRSTIYHVLNEDENDLKLFKICGDFNININGDSFYELKNILYDENDPYINTINSLVSEHKKKLENPSSISSPTIILYSDEVYDKVSKTVICQDEQIKAIASALAKNSRLENPSLKSNMLICGPTGVGKSEIFRSISENFNIPIAFEDSNEYSATSYKGKDVTEMLVHLYVNADCDIEKAQRGILIIDEIDKKAGNGNEHETYKAAVINSLLKMMEGHVYSVDSPTGNFDFDTSLLTFAFLGAFSGIEKLSSKRKTMGFMSEEDVKEQENVKNQYSDDTLKKYGLLPEFIGRCDTKITMNNLTTEDFIRIINISDKSQLILYKELFKSLGINFIYDEKTIEAIAKKANELKLGARSIKKIVENALYFANYELFSKNNYSELIISPETIEDNKQYILR